MLCLDEVFVTDVADAAIMNRLFGHMWDQGLVLVSTSNRCWAPLHDLWLATTDAASAWGAWTSGTAWQARCCRCAAPEAVDALLSLSSCFSTRPCCVSEFPHWPIMLHNLDTARTGSPPRCMREGCSETCFCPSSTASRSACSLAALLDACCNTAKQQRFSAAPAAVQPVLSLPPWLFHGLCLACELAVKPVPASPQVLYRLLGHNLGQDYVRSILDLHGSLAPSYGMA